MSRKYYGPGHELPNRNLTGGGFPLATLWLAGHEKYPNVIADGLPKRSKPWLIDVETMLTTMLPTNPLTSSRTGETK